MKVAYLIKPNSVPSYRVSEVTRALSKLLHESAGSQWDVRTYKVGAYYTSKDLLAADKVFVDLGDDNFNINFESLTRGALKELYTALLKRKSVYGIYKRQIDNTYQAYKLNFIRETPYRIDFLGKDPILKKDYVMNEVESAVSILEELIRQRNPSDLYTPREVLHDKLVPVTKSVSDEILEGYKRKVKALEEDKATLVKKVQALSERVSMLKQQEFAQTYGANVGKLQACLYKTVTETWHSHNPLTDAYTTKEKDYEEEQRVLLEDQINNTKVSKKLLIKL